MANNEISRYYQENRFFVEGVQKEEPGNYLVTARVPNSVTCPDLLHLSPSDFTLAIMQAAATAALREYSVKYPDVLFLSHKAQYLDQDQSLLVLNCRLKTPRSGALSVLNIQLTGQGRFEGQLMGGIVKEMLKPVIENLEPIGIRVSQDQVTEVLSIYSGMKQSNVVAVGFDKESGSFEAAVYFPPYTEMTVLDHVSARQMIEALMKAAYCGAAHLAYSGELPINYEELLANRLIVRTLKHDIRYGKLLNPHTQSLLRFQISTEGNRATVHFTHRPNVSEQERSFATGRMVFYLPNEQPDP